MTPSRSQRARRPETILRELARAVADMGTFAGWSRDAVNENHERANACISELRRALNKEKRP